MNKKNIISVFICHYENRDWLIEKKKFEGVSEKEESEKEKKKTETFIHVRIGLTRNKKR